MSALGGCGDEGSAVEPSTTRAADESWFAFSPVLSIAVPPCDADATPSADEAACYELGEQLVGPSGIVAAEASGFEVPAECEETPVGQLCLDTDPPDGAQPSGRTEWSVALTLSADAVRVFNALAAQCFNRALDCPLGQIAVVIDGAVVSAPTIQQPAFEADQFQISGGFTEAEARELAGRFD
jgi:hypothetical protein